MEREKTEVLGIQAPKTWIDLPKNVPEQYSYWEFLDEISSWFLQGAAVIAASYVAGAPDPITNEIAVTSSGGVKVYFPMWGSLLTPSNGTSFTVPSGDHIILIPHLSYPVEDRSEPITCVTAEEAKDLGQFCFFLGGRRGNVLYLRPDVVL